MELIYYTLADFAFGPDPEDANSACSNYKVTTLVETVADNIPESAWWSPYSSLTQLVFDQQEPVAATCYDTSGTHLKKRGRPSDQATGTEGALIPDPWPEKSLQARGEGTELFPGWMASVGAGVTLGVVFKGDSPFNPGGDLPDQVSPALDCRLYGGCSATGTGGPNDPNLCCGCTNMDYVFGYSDIGPCEGCNEDWDGGEYPALRRGAPLVNRAITGGNNSEPRLSIPSNPENATADSHELERRVAGIATLTERRVRFCGIPLSLGGEYRYPAFPADPSYPWDGIEAGIWDFIPRYYGNASADCSDWSVAAIQPADETDLPVGRVRAKYQTEHVFEGQLIGDFFTWWLNQGRIRN